MRTQLSVFEKSYWDKKTRLMSSAYPRTAQIVGVAQFSKLVLAYFKKYPCDSFEINEMGRHLPKFLRQRNPWHKTPYLAELSRFEWAELWARHQFKQFQSENKCIGHLREIAVHPGLQLISSFYSLHSRSTRRLKVRLRKPHFYAIGFDGHKICCHPLRSIEFRILNWVELGSPMESLARRAARIGYNEKKFFKILFSLQKRGLLKCQFRLN